MSAQVIGQTTKNGRIRGKGKEEKRRTDVELANERMRRVVTEDLTEGFSEASRVAGEAERGSVSVPSNELGEVGRAEEVVKL
jgi:hypothetical protein